MVNADMGFSPEATAEIVITAAEPGSRYNIFVRRPNGERNDREVELPRHRLSWTRLPEDLHPFAIGFEQAILKDVVRDAVQIDLFLPFDPIACLDWERI